MARDSSGYKIKWPQAPFPADDQLTTAELAAFAGESPQIPGGAVEYYYLKKWTPVLEGRTWFAGANWAALLFGMNWCFWRRLYVLGVVVFVAEMVLGLIATVIVFLMMGLTGADVQDARPNGVWLLALPIVRLPLCFTANRLYLQKGFYKIRRARGKIRKLHDRVKELRRRGGGNMVGLLISLAIAVVLTVLNTMAAA